MSPTVTHIVGARPNFVKAAPVVAALGTRGVEQRLIHTGQHYDALMSDVFFAELGLPEPSVNLGVGSGTHATQTATLLVGLEQALQDDRPDALVVYGDVNSTLAAALVAAKLLIPLVHVEAGLRSFDPTMPEEVNRLVVDRLADLLLVTSPEAVGHLAREGKDEAQVQFVGNTMIDTLLQHRHRLDPSGVAERLGVQGSWALVTLHRPGNVDDVERSRNIVDQLLQVSELLPIVVPLHPRGRQQLESLGLVPGPRVHVVDPLGYLDFVSLADGAAVVVTDSGGVQEETTVLDTPCLTVRPNTERPVTITHGTNRLVTIDRVAAEVRALLTGETVLPVERPAYWDGRAGGRAADAIVAFLARGTDGA